MDLDCKGVSLHGSDEDGYWMGTPHAPVFLPTEEQYEVYVDGKHLGGDTNIVIPETATVYCIGAWLGSERFLVHLLTDTEARARQYVEAMGARVESVCTGEKIQGKFVPYDYFHLNESACSCV